MNIFAVLLGSLLNQSLPMPELPNEQLETPEPIEALVCATPMCVYHPWVPLQTYTAPCPRLCVWYDGQSQVCTDPTPNSWECTPGGSSCWWDCDRIL